jgi:hypothetical protein
MSVWKMAIDVVQGQGLWSATELIATILPGSPVALPGTWPPDTSAEDAMGGCRSKTDSPARVVEAVPRPAAEIDRDG